MYNRNRMSRASRILQQFVHVPRGAGLYTNGDPAINVIREKAFIDQLHILKIERPTLNQNISKLSLSNRYVFLKYARDNIYELNCLPHMKISY